MTDHLCDFLRDNQLDKQYLEQASRWFQLLLEDLVDRSHHTNDNRTLLVGISGCQGSGKSTLANYLTLQLNHSFEAYLFKGPIDAQTVKYCIDDFASKINKKTIMIYLFESGVLYFLSLIIKSWCLKCYFMILP